MLYWAGDLPDPPWLIRHLKCLITAYSISIFAFLTTAFITSVFLFLNTIFQCLRVLIWYLLSLYLNVLLKYSVFMHEFINTGFSI